MDGKYETRLLRIRFELLPEMDDVRINCACVRIALITPHRVQQTIPTKRFPGVGYEVRKQRKLFRGKINGFAGASHFIAANVDLNIAEPVNLWCGCLRRDSSQHSFHPGHQLANREWLGDV